jgi:small subunit ribosomal protein S25e
LSKVRVLSAKEERKAETPEEIEKLVEKAKKDLAKVRYITPFKLSQRYGISYGSAKKILKRLEEEGVLVRYSGTRRSPIYVPVGKEPAFKTIGVGVRVGERST